MRQASGSGAQGRGGQASPKVLRQYISRFPQASVLVIGDLILDHYIWGRVSRISPEAPVPVVHVDSESLKLGGAANVFNNILALGGKADLCGVIGSDESGRMLLKELGSTRSGRGGVVIDQDRPTTRKSRVIAHNQQIVRYDVERRAELKPAMQRRILRYVESRSSAYSRPTADTRPGARNDEPRRSGGGAPTYLPCSAGWRPIASVTTCPMRSG
ncbi:MAG: rfaEa [candidate division NC10 bacterium]|nr:rfaEa [candidate division NC10 bacterium]